MGPKALIVGAGIGGLTAAICLRRIGCDVKILEQSPVFGDVGAGIQLGPNASRILSSLGLAAKIRSCAFEPEFIRLRDFKSGKIELDLPVKSRITRRYKAPYWHIHRADLLDVLRQAALDTGAEIQAGMPVSAVTSDADKATAISGESLQSADILIGADGIRSVVRKFINPQYDPEFTGQIAWRGLVDASLLPENTISPDATVWMGPGAHFVAYYIRGGTLVNFVAVAEEQKWSEENWNLPGDISALRNRFAGWAAPVTTILSQCQSCHKWGLFDHQPMPKWSDGRVTLLGDACHPMLPFMAQGAAMAIEDAYNLANAINANTDLSAALRHYQNRRICRTARVQKLSTSNAKTYHLKNPAFKFWRRSKFFLANHISGLANWQFDWLYGYNQE